MLLVVNILKGFLIAQPVDEYIFNMNYVAVSDV